MAERGMSPEAQAQIDAARRVLADHDAQACKDVARLIAKLEKTERALDCAKGAHFKAQLEHEERAAKLEQAERERDDLRSLFNAWDARALAAESALAAAQGALRAIAERGCECICDDGCCDKDGNMHEECANAGHYICAPHAASIAAESGKPGGEAPRVPERHRGYIRKARQEAEEAGVYEDEPAEPGEAKKEEGSRHGR